MAEAESVPTEAEVRDHLARILASPSFPAGSQTAKVLTFVVERTLAGDSASLKAYTIAVEALGRPADFDAESDSSVRVTMKRVRSSLEIYYGGIGRDEPLRIVLSPGSYRPAFVAASVALPFIAPPMVPAAASTEPFLSTRMLLFIILGMSTLHLAFHFKELIAG
ncbi:MAG: hypothetical protein WCH83_17070 [Alphaproteobacteria bacterium]|jgi:hypothetical protein